ncbi:MAG: lysylphosphatidylglycerol synthase transmembrane domain-containing protein [Candidatus Eisenbacteria bacterium]|nr:lysylphosphatidylglycerol synthase transmembrane domain-containing protein [Candidatus Eisenbacteria bacterium]
MRRWLPWLRALAGVAILAALLAWVDVRSVLGLVARIGPGIALLLFVLYVVDRVAMAWKWWWLLRSVHPGIRLAPLIRAYFYSAFVVTFLPFSAGAELVRLGAVLGEPVPKRDLFASMVVERTLGFLSMVAMALLAALLLFATHSGEAAAQIAGMTALLATGALVAFTVAAILVLRPPSALRSLLSRVRLPGASLFGRIVASMRLFVADRRTLVLFYGISFFEQLVPVWMLWLLARDLGVLIGFVQMLSVVLLSLLLTRIPVSLSGLGVQEGVFVGLFLLLGRTKEEGLAVSLAARVLDILFPLPVIALFYSDTVRAIRAARREASGQAVVDPSSPASTAADGTEKVTGTS